jgi:aminopeptidase
MSQMDWPAPYPVPDDELRRYAAVLLEVGLAFDAGKELAVNAHVEHAPLARALAEEAYARGAAYVDLWYWDAHAKASRLRHAPTETLASVPAWLEERYRVLGERQGAVVNIIGDPHPGLFADADDQRAGLDRMPGLAARFRAQLSGHVEFTTACCPTAGWAQRVLGSPDVAALWAAIRPLMRLDAEDPVRAWRERIAELDRRGATLNDLALDTVHFTGPGTDLAVGLHARHIWGSAAVTSRAGLRHAAALPTEEIFSMPDPRRAEGHVTATKPLVLGGSLVEGLRLRFERGQIVDVQADRGAEVVRAHLGLDAGARRLGEVALVDGGSPIARSGLTFYETLLDESAACHLAWGRTIPDAHRDYDAADPERTAGLGLNESATHVDFMVGGPEVTVWGVGRDGSRRALLVDDVWQLG